MRTITKENLFAVKNDICGNPRYVIHFLDILTDEEEAQFNGLRFGGIQEKEQFAVNKAKLINGKSYRGKDFGGGIVFTSDADQLVNKINNLLNK